MAPTILHIFNPDTDYALASDAEAYTPPVAVMAMKTSLCLLPVTFCEPGSAILLPPIFREQRNENGKYVQFSGNHPFAELVTAKDIKLVLPKYLPDFFISNPLSLIRPWGWNRSLRHELKSAGVFDNYLPSVDFINSLRAMSHRRLTIPFLNNMEGLKSEQIEIPVEITSSEDALDFWKKKGNTYFKAPWSSSGRGILYTKDLERRHIEPWIRGIIRSQGSILAEKAYSRTIDFASEWECINGKAKFIGFSTFVTSERGKYKSNVVMPQEKLTAYILSTINHTSHVNNLEAILERQKLLLENYIAPNYRGPLGIDMMVTDSGDIHPCVEINIRETMGHVAINIQNRIESDNATDIEKNYLKRLARGGIFSPMHFLEAMSDFDNN